MFVKENPDREKKINRHASYNDVCLTYFFTSKVCKAQYTDEIVEKFRFLWSNQIQSDGKFLKVGDIRQKFLYQHFPDEDHKGFIEVIDIF